MGDQPSIAIDSSDRVIKIRTTYEICSNDLALVIGKMLKEKMPECKVQVARFEWVKEEM